VVLLQVLVLEEDLVAEAVVEVEGEAVEEAEVEEVKMVRRTGYRQLNWVG
jgi:hypothetical protein